MPHKTAEERRAYHQEYRRKRRENPELWAKDQAAKREWTTKNSDKLRVYFREYDRERSLRDPEFRQRKCEDSRRYLLSLDEEGKQKLAARRQAYRDANREALRAKYRIWRSANPDHQKNKLQEERSKVLELWDSKCIKCGYSDTRALELDHIYGDGYVDRSDNKGLTSTGLRRLLKDTEATKAKYQLLCACCHRIKTFENNEHKKREILSPG